MRCGRRRLSLVHKTILVAAAVVFSCASALAFSVKHRGVTPRWQTHNHNNMLQRIQEFQSDKVGSRTSFTRLASSNQLHVSVTVDATVSVSSRPVVDGTTKVLATVSTSTASPTATSVETPISESELEVVEVEDESEKSDNDIDTVPMDTPARQSLPSHLCLRSMPGKGLGVICQKPIANGEVVGEYKGEVMFEDVKDRRYISSLKDEQTEEDQQWVQSRLDRGQTLTGCYLFGITLPPNYKDQTATRIYVDAEDEYESLWTRFLNHASLPFSNVHPKCIHESYDGKPRVWFVANRNIEVGDEICFDYGDDYWLEGDDVV